MNRLANTVAKAVKKALLGALMFASAVMPSAQAFMPTVASADMATVGQVFAFDAAGTGTFVVPSNVTSIAVRVWGAGGKGGDGTTISGTTYAGQGGGAGGYAGKTVSVSGGASFNYSVGQGGNGSNRTGGASSFDGVASASGGNGGANWSEIPGNGPGGGNGGSASTACYFEGTWVYHDQGGQSNGSNGNDFGVTCRNQKMTGFCQINSVATGMGRGLHAGNYACEGGSTPSSGIACDFEGTWAYNDDGGGNDLAFTCRDQQVTGWCTLNTNIARGFHAGNYQCEHGQPYTGAPSCDFDGTWSYNDEGGGNDFSISCRDWKMTGWCSTVPPMLPRGAHPSSYTCELPPSSWNFGGGSNNPGGGFDNGGQNEQAGVFDAVLAFFKPAIAYAQAAFDGRGGQGLTGDDLRSGGDAAAVTAGANSAPTAGGSSALNGHGRGGDGSASGTGQDGANGRVEITVMAVTGGPNPTDARPEGHLDGASCQAITGWAYDPDATSANITVHFYADGPAGSGMFIGSVTTGILRPDVNSFMGVTGNHGFSFNTPNSVKDGGTHRIYAYAINTVETVPSLNYELPSPAPITVSGCVSVNPTNTAPTAPSVTGPSVGTTSVSYMFHATASDADGDPIRYGYDWNNDGTIDQYTNFVTSGTTANLTHAYAPAGTYTLSVYAEDNGARRSPATAFTIVVSDSSVVPPDGDAQPVGVLDSASCSVISGWAYDPSASSTSIDVHFYADGLAGTGTFLGGVTADGSRPDVNSFEGITGNHGFTFATPNSIRDGATHTIYAYGINTVTTFPSNNALLSSVGPITVSGCTVGPVNQAPTVVSVVGTTTGSVNVSYAFTATATDPEAQSVEYGFDWNNNGVIDGGESWSSAVASGVSAMASFSWSVPGIQNFNVFARDSQGAISPAFPFQIVITGGSSNIGFVLTNTAGLSTSEAGATAVFNVALQSAPLANVTLPVASTDVTEGTVSTALLTFTPGNWNVAQDVTMTGVDDTALDGNIGYSVVVGSSTSADINFNNLPAQTVNLVNFDNEQTGGGSTGGSGGSGGGGGGQCRGFGCPTLPGATTTPDVLILIDGPVSTGPSTPVAPRYCLVDDFIADYSRFGANNNPNEVRKLQYFLNSYENAGLPVDGVFGTSTEAAVMAFQAKYAEAVLSPWGTNIPTGIVYITTRAEINRIYCSDNPTYTEGDLSDILDGVLYPPSNPDDFEGVIGSTEATSTQVAGVFGAITQDILDILRDIPWYPLLVTLLVLVGAGLMMQGIIKDTWNRDSIMSFTQGSATLGLGTVLNVLNVVSYMLNPDWLLAYAGVDISWLLALVIINLLALVAILVTLLFAISRRLARGEAVGTQVQPAK